MAGAKPGREHSFHEVLFADLNKEDATKLVTQYNAEGQVKFKKISKQYHKREKKAAQRKGARLTFVILLVFHILLELQCTV